MTAKDAPAGLIHALLLDGKGGAKELDWATVTEWQASDGALWLHFNFEDAGARAWLASGSGLNEIAAAALTAEDSRPRSLHRGDNLLLALRGLNLSPGHDPEDMISVRLWTNGQCLISTRRRALKSTEDVLAELEAGNGPVDISTLLIDWIDRIVQRMNDTIEDFDDQLTALEEDIVSGVTEGMRSKISQLRKRTLAIRRYLAPQREAMNRLAIEELNWMDDMGRLRLREINDRLIRYIEDIDEVRDRAAIAQEELSTRVAEQTNQRSYVFTVVATIFLPLGFFTGLMGINVGGMPGVDSETAFWIVVALCLLLTVLLAFLFRIKRWL